MSNHNDLSMIYNQIPNPGTHEKRDCQYSLFYEFVHISIIPMSRLLHSSLWLWVSGKLWTPEKTNFLCQNIVMKVSYQLMWESGCCRNLFTQTWDDVVRMNECLWCQWRLEKNRPCFYTFILRVILRRRVYVMVKHLQRLAENC